MNIRDDHAEGQRASLFRRGAVNQRAKSLAEFFLGLLAALSLGYSAPANGYLICVSNERSGNVTFIDGVQLNVVSTIPVGKRPRGIHASPDGHLVYVALSGSPINAPRRGGGPKLEEDEEARPADHSADGIAIIDPAQRKVLKKIPGGSDPEQFALSANGNILYIANEDNATVTAATASDGAVQNIFHVKKEPEGVALTPDGKRLFVTCEAGGEVFIIDLQHPSKVSEVRVGGRPRNVVFTRDGSRGFVTSEATGKVHILDVNSAALIKSIDLPANCRPMGLALASNGKKLYVTTGWGGVICVIDTASAAVSGTIKVGSRPWGIGLSPDGARVFVANGPSNDVSVVDVSSEKEIARVKAGEGPWGVAVVAAQP